MYDVKTQSSLALPDLPRTFGAFCPGVVLNDYFYVAKDSDILKKTNLYRICLSRRKKWEHVFRHKLTDFLNDILTDGNHIFFIFRNEIISFDPTNRKLSPTIEIPDGMRLIQLYFSALADNKIFFLGNEYMVIYDIAHQSWGKVSHPKSLRPRAAVVIDRWIVATEVCYSKDTFVYDTHTQQWTRFKMHLLSSSRSFHKYVKVGSDIITLGGYNFNLNHGNEYCPMTAIRIKHTIP